MRFDSKVVVQLLCTVYTIAIADSASAGFVDDSKASVDFRNFYMNRDFRQHNAAQNKAEEWAQGFIFREESGYTEGPIGFGLDAVGLLGVKLDSSPDRSGTSILKVDRESKRAQDEYGELGLTAKAKWSKTVLKVGTQEPLLPPLLRNDTRLLPQTFRGVSLNSKEIENLTLDVARMDRVNYRDSSDNEEMTVNNSTKRNIVLGQKKTSSEFLLGGARYQINQDLAASYYYGELDGIYRQHLVNLTHNIPLSEGQRFKSDLRFARSMGDGGSNVDNNEFGALFTYMIQGHSFSVGYQHLSGNTGFAFVNGSDTTLVNSIQINDFGDQNEHSWQLRHDYDFAALGFPGLSLMNRYVSGDNVDRGPGQSEGKTWERNTVLSYVIQSGPLKNVGLALRNASARSNYVSDIDENRLIVSYSLTLW